MITLQLPRARNGRSHNFSLEYQTHSNQHLKMNRSFTADLFYIKGWHSTSSFTLSSNSLPKNFVSSCLLLAKKPFPNFLLQMALPLTHTNIRACIKKEFKL